MATANPRQELETQVAERAAQDAAFRSRLMSNPADTLFQEFNISVPQSAKVTVLEESADNFYLILTAPTVSSDKLSDEQLESVAGGGMFGCGLQLFWTMSCSN